MKSVDPFKGRVIDRLLSTSTTLAMPSFIEFQAGIIVWSCLWYETALNGFFTIALMHHIVGTSPSTIDLVITWQYEASTAVLPKNASCSCRSIVSLFLTFYVLWCWLFPLSTFRPIISIIFSHAFLPLRGDQIYVFSAYFMSKVDNLHHPDIAFPGEVKCLLVLIGLRHNCAKLQAYFALSSQKEKLINRLHIAWLGRSANFLDPIDTVILSFSGSVFFWK